jgi:hypothetical protein
MKFQYLVDHFGSPRQVQEALGISKQLASYWKKAGIPIGAAVRRAVAETGNAVVIGGVVGVVLVSMYMPIFDLAGKIKA